MSEALHKSGRTHSAVKAVCLAVSGVNHPTDQQRVVDWLRFLALIFHIFLTLISPDVIVFMCLG